MSNDTITISEAAKLRRAAGLRGVAVATIRRWCADGRLETARKSGGTWLVSKAEILAFDPSEHDGRGWPAGVARCPNCGGHLVEGHKCDVARVRARLEQEAARRQERKGDK